LLCEVEAMSENEKNAAAQTDAQDNGGTENAAEKKKKRFTVQSPYADYAADNDRVTEEMESRAEDDNFMPAPKDLLRTVLSALALVVIFVTATVIVSSFATCIRG